MSALGFWQSRRYGLVLDVLPVGISVREITAIRGMKVAGATPSYSAHGAGYTCCKDLSLRNGSGLHQEITKCININRLA